ncbi:MAG: hypothetical protein ABEI99_08780, partial [Halobaculum sp.]
NLPFRLLVRVGSPPSGLDCADRFESPVQRLERRVEAAHTELERVCAEETLHRDHRALGFARITAGTVLPESEWSPVE